MSFTIVNQKNESQTLTIATETFITGGAEVKLKGSFQNENIEQTIPVTRPCFMFFDPVSKNFITTPYPDNLPATAFLVKTYLEE